MARRLVFLALCAVFAAPAAELNIDPRLTRLEVSMTEMTQQQNEMKDQMLQINGQLEKVTHELENVKLENARLSQQVVELASRPSDSSGKSPKIVSIGEGKLAR